MVRVAALVILSFAAVGNAQQTPLPRTASGSEPNPDARFLFTSLSTDGVPRYRIDTGSPKGLRTLLRYRSEPLPLVSAHRGGAGPMLPENCIATFAATLNQGFAMLEIDPRVSKDGVVVLHHDKTLDRTTTGTGAVSDHTLAELKAIRLKDGDGQVTPNQIPTLGEAFEWAKGKAILVIDSKDLSVAQRVDLIVQHRAESYAMIIAGSVKNAKECYARNPDIMMEVFVPDRQRVTDLEAAGVPWDNIVAFVGHEPTEDRGLIKMLHERGVLTMGGTSRNLDRQLVTAGDEEEAVTAEYKALLARGIDLIETDLPRKVWPILFGDVPVPESATALQTNEP